MNRRDTSQNIMSMTKIKRTLHLNRIALLRKHTVDRPHRTTQNTKPTVLHNWDSTGLPNRLSFPVTATLFHVDLFITQVKKSFCCSFLKRNQEKPNSKLKSWFHHKPQMWFNENKETQPLYTMLLPKEKTHQTLSERGFFMDYVHWLNKNYCIWEGTYLWFKA